MIRDVLVNLALDGETDPGADYALSVAREFGAQITGIAFALEIEVPATYFGAFPAELMLETRKQSEETAASAAARFMDAARRVGVQAETRTATLSVDGAADAFGRLARLFDVTVLGQPNPDRVGPEAVLLEAALFESGRALLVVPYVQKEPLKLDRVLVAWDGSRAATRAVAEARPFLAKAKQVEILVVESGRPDPKSIPGTDLARHLARHNLKVELRRLTVGSKQEIDSMILNEIADRNVDLVVMGGYGHSRLREFVLGGVTRGMISSMTAPVLMAH
jgi:nucleotide-binding universal stress UspA family protein